ncbi:TetR family transcriptional regulator [Shewanella sairae]|uniref:TetR family transcriptional regulator n=1 Tax=Shewanella sairae TaxID=190310 RepID=A0ABQ4PEN5_9GAMM|nr:TetR/AcrR family transcriptional regulator [Shewanella sairae]MCL1129285.1 TetR/AcrR family transcriptional regulator [Shewanella sairae]GIU46032.1 TetR family transcriptional regulator [Shewanella sairae]
MNAPSMSRSEQKREQILQAAKELFCEQGFPNTSMDEVAKLAGVSKQTVYSHFGCKDDLFVASIESKCLVHGVNQELLSDPLTPEVSLALFAKHFGEVITSPEAVTVFKACVSQSDSHPKISELFYSAGPKHILGLLAEYLAKVSVIGDYQFNNPHHCAVRLCLMVFGEVRMRLDLGLDVSDLLAEREQYINDTVEMFLKAYKTV